MKISVLTCSYRLFMKDMQVEGLANQTFKDFEWVVVDENYEVNKGFNAPFPVIHMPPNKMVDYFCLAARFNDGLAHCSGKYIFFMNDYIVPQKDCLARHWEVQERFGGCMLSGRDWAVDGTDAMQDGKKIKVKDYRMALFETGTLPSKPIDNDIMEIDRVGVQNWWAGHNDSAPLKAVLECNGFDEAFDGAWGGQDAEMANRLMTYGLKYYLDKKSIVMAFSHPRGGDKKRLRSEGEQQAMQTSVIDPKVKSGIYTANKLYLVMLPRDVKGEWDALRQKTNTNRD